MGKVSWKLDPAFPVLMEWPKERLVGIVLEFNTVFNQQNTIAQGALDTNQELIDAGKRLAASNETLMGVIRVYEKMHPNPREFLFERGEEDCFDRLGRWSWGFFWAEETGCFYRLGRWCSKLFS